MYHRQGSAGSRTPGSIPEEGFLGRPPMPTPPAQYSSQTIARMSTQKGMDARAERHAAMQQMRDVAGIASPPTSRHEIGRRSSLEGDYPAHAGYSSTLPKDRTVSDPGEMGLPPPPAFAPTPPPLTSSMYASVGDFPPSDPPPPPPPPGPPPGGPAPPANLPPPPPPPPDVDDIPLYADVHKQKSAAAPPPPPPPPPPDSPPSGGGGSFADSIAAAAALRERRKSTKDPTPTSPSSGPPSGGSSQAFDIAMAAKDNSLRQAAGHNRNQNAETQHSALEAAVARRKSLMESGRCESIEEKIQKNKEAKASIGMNPSEDLMAAIAKRRTVVEKQVAESGSSTPFSNQIASAAGQMQNKLAVKPKPVRDVPPVSPTSSPQSDQSDSPGVLLIPPSIANIKQTFEKPKKAPVALPPVVESQPPFPPAPDYPMNANEDNQNFGAILTRFNAPQNRTQRTPPHSVGGRSAVDGQHVGTRRDGSSDTSSVVSSGSSASTLSTMSMSTEPSSDMFDGGDDDFPKKNNTVKSTSSSASSSTVTSNSSWTRRSSLDDNRGKIDIPSKIVITALDVSFLKLLHGHCKFDKSTAWSTNVLSTYLSPMTKVYN